MKPNGRVVSEGKLSNLMWLSKWSKWVLPSKTSLELFTKEATIISIIAFKGGPPQDGPISDLNLEKGPPWRMLPSVMRARPRAGAVGRGVVCALPITPEGVRERKVTNAILPWIPIRRVIKLCFLERMVGLFRVQLPYWVSSPTAELTLPLEPRKHLRLWGALRGR